MSEIYANQVEYESNYSKDPEAGRENLSAGGLTSEEARREGLGGEGLDMGKVEKGRDLDTLSTHTGDRGTDDDDISRREGFQE